MTFSTVAWIFMATLFGSSFLISATPGTVQEYCPWESFNASCSSTGQLIMMTSARYGRMKVGRCIPFDYYVGCSTDVIEEVDARCSGRKTCTISIPDLQLFKLQPCRKDLMAYFEASFICVSELSLVDLQNSRDRPLVNSSNAVHSPMLSKVELHLQLQRNSKFSRRSKRDAAGVVASLSILGIALAVPFPAAGACISILAVLIQYLGSTVILSGNSGNPICYERILQQRLTLNSILRTMQEIKRQYEITNDIRIPNSRMLTLYDNLNSQRCLFMHDDKCYIKESAENFRNFAHIHIVINQALILIHPEEKTFQESLVQIVKGYVAYAKYARSPDPHLEQSRLDWYIGRWTKQLPAYKLTEVNEQGRIRNDEAVSFQLGHYNSGDWLCCWRSGTLCRSNPCPEQDNPMDRGSQYRYYWKCRGEVFFIKSVDNTGEFITSCSKVGIMYSYMHDKHWWLSNYLGYYGWYYSYTTSCAGEGTTRLRYGYCPDEVWTITARGKPCGGEIQDRDFVEIRGYHDSKPPIANIHSSGDFTIFRSNVDRHEYKKNFVCHA